VREALRSAFQIKKGSSSNLQVLASLQDKMLMNWMGNTLAISSNLLPDMHPIIHLLLPIDDDS